MNPMSVGPELLNVEMGEMIREMAFAIADAQYALDTASVRVSELMSGKMYVRDDNGVIQKDARGTPISVDTTVQFGGESVSMLELGFTPTFYQFVDTIIEVKISIRISLEQKLTLSSGTTTTTTTRPFRTCGNSKSVVSTQQVDAAYSSTYSYTAEGASLLRTKLVPVPPPPVLEERIRAMNEARIAAKAAAAAAVAPVRGSTLTG